MEKLKPCPFCGSNEVEFIEDEEQLIKNTITGYILCSNCYVTTDSFFNEERAIKAWNRRVNNE